MYEKNSNQKNLFLKEKIREGYLICVKICQEEAGAWLKRRRGEKSEFIYY